VQWKRYVREDGTLDEEQLAGREVLYIGRNGKAVERFVGIGMNVSVIFKPLTNLDTIGREIWVYEQLLPSLAVRYPHLLAYAEHRDPDRFWAIYEDLGTLRHSWDSGILLQAAQQIPSWHALPPEQIPASFEGHSPQVNEVLRQVTEVRPGWSLKNTLTGLSWPIERIRSVFSLLQSFPSGLEGETVVSHGDFHPMNLALLADGELAVMDWEYVHRNSVFWDLYNLLDITSPRYRKPVIAPSLRSEVLAAYVQRRKQLGLGFILFEDDQGNSSDPAQFQNAYCRYALVYSLWILLLIEKDLANEQAKEETDALKEQRRETVQICFDLLDALAPLT